MSGTDQPRGSAWTAIAFAVVLVVVGALWAGWRFGFAPPAPPSAPSAVSAPAVVPPRANAPPKPGPKAAAQPPAKPAAPPAPGFDVVRVEPSGNTVIAGHAAPGSKVAVTANGHVIGTATADRQGQFVILPKAPLAPGAQSLALSATSSGITRKAGGAPVTVLVPQAIAGHAAPPAVALSTAPGAAPRIMGGPNGHLSLGVIDYGADGSMLFSGTAPAGSQVRVAVDGSVLGTIRVGKDGRWSLKGGATVPVGTHMLRLDALGPHSAVEASLSQPFLRADLSRMRLAAGQWVVQPGQNLWLIARHSYGEGVRYSLIFNANRAHIHDPNLIYPGQVFTIPAPHP